VVRYTLMDAGTISNALRDHRLDRTFKKWKREPKPGTCKKSKTRIFMSGVPLTLADTYLANPNLIPKPCMHRYMFCLRYSRYPQAAQIIVSPSVQVALSASVGTTNATRDMLQAALDGSACAGCEPASIDATS
jgi:hypothetical protein